MNKQIEIYITKNYYQLRKIAKTITKGNELFEDLLHECLIQILDKDEIILESYDDNSIKYYITAIMRINWFSKTSPFYYRIKKEPMNYTNIEDILEMEDDQENYEKELLFSILEKSFAELTWFHKSILQMYLVLGSLKKVSTQSEIPITSVARYVNEAKKQIKEDIKRNIY